MYTFCAYNWLLQLSYNSAEKWPCHPSPNLYLPWQLELSHPLLLTTELFSQHCYSSRMSCLS